MNDKEYFNHPAISQSKLKDLKRSPRHFWNKHINPNRIPQKESDNMILGKLFHALVLEPDQIDQVFVIEPDIDKRTKNGREQYEEFINNNTDKIVITEEQFKTALLMQISLTQKNSYLGLFNKYDAEIECAVFWNYLDVDCKAKLDYFIKPCDKFPNGCIIDLKTTIDARLDIFKKSIYDFGYYNQAAFYIEAAKAKYNLQGDPLFIIVAIEKTSPYEAAFYLLDEGSIEFGKLENERLLNIYKECIALDQWEGYLDRLELIGLPEWATKKRGYDAYKF